MRPHRWQPTRLLHPWDSPGKNTLSGLSFPSLIQEEHVTIINIYVPNIGAPQYVREILASMKCEFNSNTMIVGIFNTLLTPMDRSTKQKINKETQTLNDTIDQLDLIDIYRTFHPKQ